MTDEDKIKAVTAALTGEFRIDQTVRVGVPFQVDTGYIVDFAEPGQYWVLCSRSTHSTLYSASQLRPL